MPYNTSVLIDPQGEMAARYRKMHSSISPSAIRQSPSPPSIAGNLVVHADAAGVNIGLTICYDIRFPELYRLLADAGVDVVCIPSSFTAPTGEAHWEMFIRARAVENQCFVIAPGQAGIGAGGIPTYGNSMIVDPWGRILARASSQGEEVISALLDFQEMANIRRRLPALRNRKLAPHFVEIEWRGHYNCYAVSSRLCPQGELPSRGIAMEQDYPSFEEAVARAERIDLVRAQRPNNPAGRRNRPSAG